MSGCTVAVEIETPFARKANGIISGGYSLIGPREQNDGNLEVASPRHWTPAHPEGGVVDDDADHNYSNYQTRARPHEKRLTCIGRYGLINVDPPSGSGQS